MASFYLKKTDVNSKKKYFNVANVYFNAHSKKTGTYSFKNKIATIPKYIKKLRAKGDNVQIRFNNKDSFISGFINCIVRIRR